MSSFSPSSHHPLLIFYSTAKLGSDAWIRDLYQLTALRQYADDPAFQEEWRTVKLKAKTKAAAHIQKLTGMNISR